MAQQAGAVLVGMSGGVDSSVTAKLLLEQGYPVTGGTMRLFDRGAYAFSAGRDCGGERDIQDARAVAQRLGIEHRVLDYGEAFRRDVIDPFVAEYLAGRTPNPCVLCNRALKYGKMLEDALADGFDYVATGHYARRVRSGGRWLLQKGRDESKDQSYFLYTLTQRQLAHFLLPLGGLTKAEVRALAEEYGFRNAEKKDSQDVCFIPDGDYGAFLCRYTGRELPAGDFVDETGAVLGRHRGQAQYTIGQRRGLNLAMGRRVYVTGKDAAANRVTLGENAQLFHSTLEAENVNWIACDAPTAPLRCAAKIRHARREAPATVEQIAPGRIRVRFDEPQRAPAPGQAVVLYDGDIVLGGGTIERVCGGD